MGIQYYFNNLDPNDFQRLISDILRLRFGEHYRLTPRYGSDGGKDGETSPYNPLFEFKVNQKPKVSSELIASPEPGRYLFQVKYHRTIDMRLSDARKKVISDFKEELEKNVLNKQGKERVNFFILITNVPSSEKSIELVDKKQKEISSLAPYTFADIWWEETIEAYLDQMPQIWHGFPELFAGGKVPFLTEVVNHKASGLPRSIRMAIEKQYNRDNIIKFRQINLEQSLQKLFTSLDIDMCYFNPEESQKFLQGSNLNKQQYIVRETFVTDTEEVSIEETLCDALSLLMDEKISSTRKILVEGGPGQGKSTITQMLAQIYRQHILNSHDLDAEGRWQLPQKLRLPLRIELRFFAEMLNSKTVDSIEEFLANMISRDAGGSKITVDNIHDILEQSPVLLIFDGLDEVGNDELRNEILQKIDECIFRLENNLGTDLKLIVTTRPPLIKNCRDFFVDFVRAPLALMKDKKIDEYVKRWTQVRIQDEDDRREVKKSFEQRRVEQHVQALAKNPMQLSVLLHFIYFKSYAFPDRRAELYKEYFKTVIDRDVEKSTKLREQRDIIEALHKFLGYKIHALIEAKISDGTLNRKELLELVSQWLRQRGSTSKAAQELFKLGEERLGLIVALRGEGEETVYGFDIQPVREYFAAAFINDDIVGNAHNVFQHMLCRPYWREVSLFLAGLRRPNEKADLIARAKDLDNNDAFGWRQMGLKIIIQLLTEGTLSETPYILSDALNFVFDLLDPQIKRFQVEPERLNILVTSLSSQKDFNRSKYAEKILRMLNNEYVAKDDFVFNRIAISLFSILRLEDFAKVASLYKGADLYFKARLNLYWAARYNTDISSILDSSFWQNFTPNIWASSVWDTVILRNTSIVNYVPQTIHPLLFESLLFSKISPLVVNRKDIIVSNWAIWKIVNIQRILSNWYTSPSSYKQIASQYTKNELNIDYCELSSDIQEVSSFLIEKSHSLITSLNDGIKNNDSLKNTALIIREIYLFTQKNLHKGGLSSWLICSYVLSFERFLLNARELKHSREVFNISRLLLDNITQFYSWEYLKEHYLHGRLLTDTDMDYYPELIVLDGGKTIKLLEVLSNKLIKAINFPYSWLNNIHIKKYMLRPLVEMHRSNLEIFLFAFGKVPFTPLGEGQSLAASDIRLILNIASETDDPQILLGSVIALASSSFIQMAGLDLCLKLISADIKGYTAAIIFRYHDTQGSHSNISIEEKQIIIDIAREIKSHPEKYPVRLNLAAASFLDINDPITFPPLLSMEDELQIHIYEDKERED